MLLLNISLMALLLSFKTNILLLLILIIFTQLPSIGFSNRFCFLYLFLKLILIVFMYFLVWFDCY